MAKVKLSATLPKDDTAANGLDTLAKALIQRPTQSYVVVGLVTGSRTIVDHDRGNARQPEVRFVAIEGVDDADDIAAVMRVIERCATRRNGADPNQLDIRYGDTAYDDDVDV